MYIYWYTYVRAQPSRICDLCLAWNTDFSFFSGGAIAIHGFGGYKGKLINLFEEGKRNGTGKKGKRSNGRVEKEEKRKGQGKKE